MAHKQLPNKLPPLQHAYDFKPHTPRFAAQVRQNHHLSTDQSLEDPFSQPLVDNVDRPPSATNYDNFSVASANDLGRMSSRPPSRAFPREQATGPRNITAGKVALYAGGAFLAVIVIGTVVSIPFLLDGIYMYLINHVPNYNF